VAPLAYQEGAEELSTAQSPGASYAYVMQPYSLMPDGTAFTTAAAFDALQWGLKLTSNTTTVRLSQVVVAVIQSRASGRRNILGGYQHTVAGDDNLIAGQSNTVRGAASESHGVGGEVVGNRSVSFNLDGVPRTLTGDGKFWINGEEVTTGSVPSSGYAPELVRKAADESVTSSTVLQNDNELFVTLDAGSTYEVRFALFYTAATAGDLKWQWSGPTDIVGADGALRISNSASSSEGSVRASASSSFTSGLGGVLSAGGTGAAAYLFGSMVLVTTTGGNLQLTWAQETSSGTATTVLAGSYLIAQKF
jgi:hypothetical protein